MAEEMQFKQLTQHCFSVRYDPFNKEFLGIQT